MYDFVSGPLVWIAFIVFVGGLVYQFVTMLRLAKKDKVVYPYMSVKYGLRSLAPLDGTVCFQEHADALRDDHHHFCFSSMSSPGSDISHRSRDDVFVCMGAEVGDSLGANRGLVDHSGHTCGRFLPGAALDAPGSKVRHLCVGLSATRRCRSAVYHRLHGPQQWFDYETMVVIHMISGAVMLMAIPFTRLSHMLFFPFTRAYMGSEFGAVRHAKDW